MRNMLFILLLSISSGIFAQDLGQSFISLSHTGVSEFLANHPEYDGRGTVIFIFDTGVDMGIDGLLTTSTGETKVIDVQDFTGQGDINYFEADADEEDNVTTFSNSEHGLSVKTENNFEYEPVDGEYFIGALPENLWLNSNSGIRDINGNGTVDDLFHFVTFKTKTDTDEFWVLYFDSDDDGYLSDEKATRAYRVNQDKIRIKTANDLPLLTMAINFKPEENKVSFFFDDGSHGTNCAGIAAGYKIDGMSFNGVAPGAKVIACKLGNNNFSGGATVTESMIKSYLYADKLSKELDMPCIISMSYGVGSEIEGHSDMEKFLKELTDSNPYLYISLSNSNEGPGISSTGQPSASNSVMSSGAALAYEVGNDLYGTFLDKDIILHFSSRGGAVKKPDIISPGASASTIPNYDNSDRMWGTSMAAPYTAGVMSLLMSAVKAEYPDTKIPSQLLYTAIRESATWMEDYTHLDQGGGYINMVKAYELLKKFIDTGEVDNFETYTTDSFAPNMPYASAPCLYIRNATYLSGNETFKYTITRNNLIDKAKFYRNYNLSSDSDWLVPAQKKIHLRNDQSATVTVNFKKSLMQEPGLYNGMIKAERADKSGFPEFELMATVVVPYKFDSENSYSHYWRDVQVKPGALKRYFLRVPPGASNLRVKLSSEVNELTDVRYYLFDNDGRIISRGIYNAEEEEGTLNKYYMNIDPGVYEFDIVGSYLDQNPSEYNLFTGFDAVHRTECNVLKEGLNKISIINLFDQVNEYNVSAEILGYVSETDLSFEGGDEKELPLKFNENEAGKKIDLLMSKQDFNKLTDFAVLILDDDGLAVKQESLSYQFGSLELNNIYSGTKNLKLKFVPGFTYSESNLTLNVKNYTTVNSPLKIAVRQSSVVLYPSVTNEIDLNCPQPDFEIPQGSRVFGKLYLKCTSSGNTELEIPLYFNFQGADK